MKSKVFSVTQINTYIKRMFQSDYALRRISIKGQVSNCKYHSSGHIYFSLKDEESQISCVMRGPADREWLKIKKDNEKYKICRNSDITMYVGLRGFFDIDDGESDPWKDKTYEDFYIGGYFISRYEQDAGIYYKNSKGEKIEDAGCNQYMSKKNPYGIQKT